MEGRNNVGRLKQIIQNYENTIHAAWSCIWSPNTGAVNFLIEESRPCSVVVDQGEK
jgi:hypothetical protein